MTHSDLTPFIVFTLIGIVAGVLIIAAFVRDLWRTGTRGFAVVVALVVMSSVLSALWEMVRLR